MLDVGTGSGYQAAVLAELGGDVVTIERVPELAEQARAALAEAGYGAVEVRVGDGTLGVADRAPYEAIAVAAAAPAPPPALLAQLAPEGRLVVPVGGPARPAARGGARPGRQAARAALGRLPFRPARRQRRLRRRVGLASHLLTRRNPLLGSPASYGALLTTSALRARSPAREERWDAATTGSSSPSSAPSGRAATSSTSSSSACSSTASGSTTSLPRRARSSSR